MSHFYASIQGNRGEGTRGGTKKTGINGHIRGWSMGCRVDLAHNEESGEDCMTIMLTGGSRQPGTIEYLLTLRESQLAKIRAGEFKLIPVKVQEAELVPAAPLA